jgi:hypothetical protein
MGRGGRAPRRAHEDGVQGGWHGRVPQRWYVEGASRGFLESGRQTAHRRRRPRPALGVVLPWPIDSRWPEIRGADPVAPLRSTGEEERLMGMRPSAASREPEPILLPAPGLSSRSMLRSPSGRPAASSWGATQGRVGDLLPVDAEGAASASQSNQRLAVPEGGRLDPAPSALPLLTPWPADERRSRRCLLSPSAQEPRPSSEESEYQSARTVRPAWTFGGWG